MDRPRGAGDGLAERLAQQQWKLGGAIHQCVELRDGLVERPVVDLLVACR